MSDRMKKIIYFCMPLLIVVAVFVVLGMGKRITFCDEIYTYTITNSDKLLDQYEVNSWMSGPVLNNALLHDGGDSFGRMLRQVKGDMVHPPIYYALMYISSCLFSGRFSIWAGLLVNLGALLVSAAVIWLIIYRFFNSEALSALAVILYVTNQSTLSDAMLIRMYMVYTMFVLLFFYANVILHNGESGAAMSGTDSLGTSDAAHTSDAVHTSDMKKTQIWRYVFLGACTVGGFLTQYYFAIIAVLFFLVELVRAIRIKRIKDAVIYLITMVSSVAVSTLLWNFWIRAVLGNTHAGAMKESALGLFDNLKKLWLGYMMLMNSVFQAGQYVFAIMVPAIIIAGLVLARKAKSVSEANNKETGCLSIMRWSAVGFAVAVIYAGIVRVITPEYLTSTRYYYAVDALMLVAFLTAVFYVTGCVVNYASGRTGGRLSDDKQGSANGYKLVCVILSTAAVIISVVLCNSMNGIDYYTDSKTYDTNREPLTQYADVPWVIGGADSWLIDTCITDFVIPQRIVRLLNTEAAPSDLFEGIDEFVFAEYNPENNEALTERNLYYFALLTDKELSYEKITTSKELTYYYCKVQDRDAMEMQEIRDFIAGSLDCLWIIVNDDGWYRVGDILEDGQQVDTIRVDSTTPYDETQALAGYDKAVIAVSILDLNKTPEDIGVYYMIGSTGRFFKANYVGQTRGVMLFSCDLVTE